MTASLSSIPSTKVEEAPLQKTFNGELEKEREDNNRHLYVVIEQEEGTILPVSFEMLGEARRLMDDFNQKYKPEEKVVAIILGHNIKHLCNELIHHGADAVIYADHPELRYPRNLIYTKIVSQIATDKECAARIWPSGSIFNRPRSVSYTHLTLPTILRV